MRLTFDEIRKLMETPRNGDSIVAGGSLQDKHKVHITGEGYKREIKNVEGFESANDYNVKMQVAKPATIQITSIILDNLNRWTTAQGTVKKVTFKDPEKDKSFRGVLDQVWNNTSLDRFINTFYKDAIYTEFNGFVLVTKPKVLNKDYIIKNGIITERPDGSLLPYLIFIANSDVYDFYLSGDRVEYIIVSMGDNYYRLIDDEKDIVYRWEKGKDNNVIPTEGDDGYLINELGYVPARKISNINADLLNDQVKTSPIHHILPALDRYFSVDADLRMQFIRHNYPKLAIVTKECPACGGSGKVPLRKEDGTLDIDVQVSCSTCSGTGSVIPISRDGVIGLPQNLEQGDTAFPGAPATYITPDTESLRLGLEDLQKQREDIIYSGTGDKNLISESLNTATENVINSRSLEDRIREITLMIEDFETFIIKAIKDSSKDFAGNGDFLISIRYGKRISTKSEDELLREMETSKKAGMPVSYVSALHKDLIYAKYKNNIDELDRQLILADVEPLSGYSIDELDKVKDYVASDEMFLKVNFDSIITELEQTVPIQYFMKEKPYGDRLAKIKLLIDEILQKRIRARRTSAG